MKTLPNRTIKEIAESVFARIGITRDQIKMNSGGGGEEQTWAIATIARDALKEGWGKSAIARYIGCSRYTIIYHCKKVGIDVQK